MRRYCYKPFHQQAVVHAPPRSTELAFSVANRAACLLQLEKLDEAISDCSWCLQLPYPKDKLYKIYNR